MQNTPNTDRTMPYYFTTLIYYLNNQHSTVHILPAYTSTFTTGNIKQDFSSTKILHLEI